MLLGEIKWHPEIAQQVSGRAEIYLSLKTQVFIKDSTQIRNWARCQGDREQSSPSSVVDGLGNRRDRAADATVGWTETPCKPAKSTQLALREKKMPACELFHVSFLAIFMVFFLRLTKRYEAQIGSDHIQTEDCPIGPALFSATYLRRLGYLEGIQGMEASTAHVKPTHS